MYFFFAAKLQAIGHVGVYSPCIAKDSTKVSLEIAQSNQPIYSPLKPVYRHAFGHNPQNRR